MRWNAILPAGILIVGPVFAQQGPLPPPREPVDNSVQQASFLPPQQLQNMVAPLALYPDPLLSQILAASTYPLEIIEAQQWVRQAGNLRGQELIDAAKTQNWDPSVQALVAFPDVLALLTRDVRWTKALGDAFLNQQADVMAAIQTMRASARANGRLQSTPQQEVTVEDNPDPQYGGQQAIEIEPTDPQVIYPPTYDPSYVWGPSAYGAYPDLLYPDYGFGFYPPVYIGSYFGGYGLYGGWGWGFNWWNQGLFVNSRFFDHYGFRGGYRGFGGGRSTWAHDPGHRWNVPYSNGAVAGRFSGSTRFNGNRGSFNAGQNRNSFTQAPSGQQGFRSFSNGPSQSRGQYRNFSNQAPQVRQPQNFQRGFTNPGIQRGNQNFRSMPQQTYRAPQQQQFRQSAPQQHFSAPRQSAPRGGGGAPSGGGGRHR